MIVLDDLGLKNFDLNSSLALIEILDDRYKKGAIIITSQLPISKWYGLFDEVIREQQPYVIGVVA